MHVKIALPSDQPITETIVNLFQVFFFPLSFHMVMFSERGFVIFLLLFPYRINILADRQCLYSNMFMLPGKRVSYIMDILLEV